MERTSRPEFPPLPPPPAGRTEVRKTLRPGQRGTKKLLKVHGADLVCVRYRYDERAGQRLKTIEIVVRRARWRPPRRVPNDALVSVKVEPWEKALQERLRSAGARWDPALRLWRMRYDKAVELRVRRRLVNPRPHQKGGQKQELECVYL
jgi:hypothetical protein